MFRLELVVVAPQGIRVISSSVVGFDNVLLLKEIDGSGKGKWNIFVGGQEIVCMPRLETVYFRARRAGCANLFCPF